MRSWKKEGFSLADIARLLDVPYYSLNYRRREGYLPGAEKVGNRLVYSAQDVVRIAELFGVEIKGEVK